MLNRADEITFWSRQLSEHALFLHLGLELAPYKANAMTLHKEWEAARVAHADVAPLVTKLQDFQHEVLAKLQSGTWCGWLFPLFIEHIIREANYFAARAWYSGFSPETTLAENLRFMREHALFAAHLLDPSEADLIRQAVDAAGEFQNVEAQCCAGMAPQLLDLSQRAGQALDQYLTTQPVTNSMKGIIHPVLGEHVVREGRRFLMTLQELR